MVRVCGEPHRESVWCECVWLVCVERDGGWEWGGGDVAKLQDPKPPPPPTKTHWIDRQQGDPVGRWVRVGLGLGGWGAPDLARAECLCGRWGGEGGGGGKQAFTSYDTILNIDHANTVLYFSTGTRN